MECGRTLALAVPPRRSPYPRRPSRHRHRPAGAVENDAPPDAAGVYSIIEFCITPTGHSYFYSYTRLLSQFFLVTGLD